MLQASLKRETDVVVVGSGPGGATIARELARAGKSVVLLEMGRDHRGRFYYGTHLGAVIYGDKSCLLFTEEGLNVVRPLMTGGATNMFTGSAARPPSWLKEGYGVDIDVLVEETIAELGIGQLPDESLGTASKYPEGHVLMIGDALGDHKAAVANGALFFPVNPGAEEASWKRFYEEGADRFLSGTFAGEYERSLLAEFNSYLPEKPPWPLAE